jgi:hypothetical protein
MKFNFLPLFRGNYNVVVDVILPINPTESPVCDADGI